jgi:hypothetical protein
MTAIPPTPPLSGAHQALTVADISGHRDVLPILRQQAAVFLEIERQTPRAGSIFGTQQRYLLAQLASAMMFADGKGELHLSRYLEAVLEHRIASRNTAHDFIREMEHYGIIKPAPSPADKRSRPLVLPEQTQRLLGIWVAIHLQTLDAFDKGARDRDFRENPQRIAQVYPRIVSRILASQNSTAPQGTFSLFTWMNDGGLVMDKMIATIADFNPADGRVVTGIATLDELAAALRVTKTHLSRKMAEAERGGHVGWVGRRGASRLWLSPQFLEEYVGYQADKLARIDEAYAEVLL